jgi:tetratricopeptide (TPR) repeat protein
VLPPDPFLESSDIPSWDALEAPAAPPGAWAIPEPHQYRWEELPEAEPILPVSPPPAEPFAVKPVAQPPEGLPMLELEPLSFLTGLGEPPPAAMAMDEDLLASLSDIDFQLDYGSPEEAKIEIENALLAHPLHPELLRRLDLAEAALQRMGLEPAAGEGSLGDFEHSFFDLSDILGDALLETGDGEERHDATHVVEKIQSVDELFNAFREGVEQQVKGDDYDTHYNLGIAYKEMLLLDPAIEEFKKAMRDPERTLECCSMLAICEQAQNNLDNAVAWLKQGIEAPGFPPEDAMGLHYDLGLILRDLGRPEAAREEFRIVLALDPEYRDVASMLN